MTRSDTALNRGSIPRIIEGAGIRRRNSVENREHRSRTVCAIVAVRKGGLGKSIQLLFLRNNRALGFGATFGIRNRDMVFLR